MRRKKLPPWVMYDERYHRRRRSQVWLGRGVSIQTIGPLVAFLVIGVVLLVRLVIHHV